jgi:hypothetical protein
MGDRRIAVVHDWLDTWGGGENVLAQILRAYPDADLFSLVDFLPEPLRPQLQGKHARHHVPAAHARRAQALPRLPPALPARDRQPRPVGVRPHPVELARGRQGRAHASRPGARMLLPHADALRMGPARSIPRAARSRLRGSRPRRTSPARSAARLGSRDQRARRRVRRQLGLRARNGSRVSTTARRPSSIHPSTRISSRKPARRTAITISRPRRWVPYKRIDVIVAAFASFPSGD